MSISLMNGICAAYAVAPDASLSPEYTNEAKGGSVVGECLDQTYLSQIVATAGVEQSLVTGNDPRKRNGLECLQ